MAKQWDPITGTFVDALAACHNRPADVIDPFPVIGKTEIHDSSSSLPLLSTSPILPVPDAAEELADSSVPKIDSLPSPPEVSS